MIGTTPAGGFELRSMTPRDRDLVILIAVPGLCSASCGLKDRTLSSLSRSPRSRCRPCGGFSPESVKLLQDAWEQGTWRARQRNPDWQRDELILALDLYLRLGRRVPDDENSEGRQRTA
jgi:hypothetical protein